MHAIVGELTSPAPLAGSVRRAVNGFVQGSTAAFGLSIQPTAPSSPLAAFAGPEVTVVSHVARISLLTLVAAALLAIPPASVLAANGGATAGGAPAAEGGSAGGATAGTVATPPRAGSRGTPPRGRKGVGGATSAHRRRARAHRAPAAALPGPPAVATLLADGTAVPPAGAPAEVAATIAAGNRIASLPYRWGGGHRTWEDTGYDCSGSVGYALHGGGLLDATADSTGLMSYGQRGAGTWITLYANRSHVYMVVAGLRFDTSGASPSRWQAASRSDAGFAIRHPSGL